MLASTGRIVSLLELGEFDVWTVLEVTIVLICSVVITGAVEQIIYKVCFRFLLPFWVCMFPKFL
jgi:hypothetical protein